VEDRAYPCLDSRQISLNVISAAAHFIASGLIDSIWLPLKVVGGGYNNFKNQVALPITYRVPVTINLAENNFRPG